MREFLYIIKMSGWTGCDVLRSFFGVNELLAFVVLASRARASSLT